MSKKRVLVTTPLGLLGGDWDEIVFLGEWAAPFANERQDQGVPRITLPYHWEDRDKLHRDYEYLSELGSRIIEAIANSSDLPSKNFVHSRSWRIVLGPWLMHYLSSLFDRWETIRLLTNANLGPVVTMGEITPRLPRSHVTEEAIRNMFVDRWNHELFLDIIKRHAVEIAYIDDCLGLVPNATVVEASGNLSTKSPRSLLVSAMSRVLVRGALRLNDRWIFASGLPIKAELKLAIPGKFIPLGPQPYFSCPTCQPSASCDVSLPATPTKFAPQNDFEVFLADRIYSDIPLDCSIHLSRLDSIRRPKKRSKRIVTSLGHWYDDSLRYWIAREVDRGAELITVAHGGSIPPAFNLHGYEKAIADAEASWFSFDQSAKWKVFPQKHLSDVKRLKHFGADKGTHDVLVVGFSTPRYATRASAGPQSSSYLEYLKEVSQAIKCIDTAATPRVTFRPYPEDYGWEQVARLKNHCQLPLRISDSDSIIEDIGNSRLIVCTYPDTTFAQAMASGRPTILFFVERYFERHSYSLLLLEKLRSAQLLFSSSREIGAHIRDIWGDVDAWWEAPATVEARTAFLVAAYDTSRDWQADWIGLLRMPLQPPAALDSAPIDEAPPLNKTSFRIKGW